MATVFIYVALFILGLGMLVRGLVTVSRARTAWAVRSVSATGRVIGCRPVSNSHTDAFNTFSISVQYKDTRGRTHTVELPAMQQFQTGDPIDIRFDPQHPATAYLTEQFAGTNLPMALIAFGSGLMIVSFISLAY
jgi:Protein of unknown function (DUF3592)